MGKNIFVYMLLILAVVFMAGCVTGIPQIPIDNNLQNSGADQENYQDESTGVPRVVFIELFNTDGCAASKAINPIIEEIVAEYENTEVILLEMAGWGKYATDETSERFKWYFSDKSELHTPSLCFNGLNQLFTQGFSSGGGGNSGTGGSNQGTEDEQDEENENSEDDGDSINQGIKEPVWSGLGITLFHTYNISEFDSYVDDLLANGFTEIRVGSPDWNDEWGSVNIAKAAVVRAIEKGAKVSWGITQTATTITAKNWPAFRSAILSTAQWAQDHGVYEFKIGNEEEYHIDGTTMTVDQIIANLKSVATDVKQIFTNGKVCYSCWQETINDWIGAGKGDIDILASNVYIGGDGYYSQTLWKNRINALLAAFGPSGTYLTEFGPSYTSLDDYSTDETVQAEAVTEMIDYIKDSGMKRAVYFMYKDMDWIDGFGARRADGTYRLLWNQALLNKGTAASTAVAAKTAIRSLPGAIAFVPEMK